MSTNVNLLGKGLKYLGVLVFLFIAAPVSLTMGFKALKKFKDTPNEFLSYLIVAAAGILIVFTIFFAFKTFRILLKAIFSS
jgi:zinc transporter ZupT